MRGQLWPRWRVDVRPVGGVGPAATILYAATMKSVFWIVPGSIAGRPGPQWEPWSVAELRAGGFDAVINLSEHPSDNDAFKAVGIESHWVPLPTDIPPTKEGQERCIAALPGAFAFVTAQTASGRRVLVHCHGGRDRTGMLLALVLAKREGLSARAAIDKVRETRPNAITAAGWEALALEVIPRVIAKLP